MRWPAPRWNSSFGTTDGGCCGPGPARIASRTSSPRRSPSRVDLTRFSGRLRAVGEGVSELQIDYRPGYRVYFKNQGPMIVILLAGGDKRTQCEDVKTAFRLARNLQVETMTKTVASPKTSPSTFAHRRVGTFQ